MSVPQGSAPGPKVGRTPGTVLAVAAMMGAGLTWLATTAWQYLGQPLPRIPLVAGLALGVAAALVGRTAHVTRQQIQVKRQRVEPARAVALLALGKTVLIAGVGLAAAYLTLVGVSLPNLQAALPAERVLNSAVAGLMSGLLAWAGWRLEDACTVPDPPSDDDSDAPEQEPGSAEFRA
ncbi:MAG: DUF3180 domain-containing protein [Micropruina sp.]|nr:DUF3180 domain-containing protein [Micropruina sp.]